MSITAANALLTGGYEIERVTVETQPRTNVRIDIRSDLARATVVLHGVVGLELRQQWSNWPFGLEFVDISDRQLERVNVAVTDGQADQFRCQCALVEVQTDQD